MPDYRTFPQELKDAVQTGVKFFLQEEGVAVNPIETFHMVPTRLEDSFREWAFLELTRCFPASVVLRK
ncbi:hypothetical protein BCR33DRAFT_156475 [Rhizoclosmatium globosum]|uniref:Uncharacterized protein n=1 Tax=Rhizoclosmatium globosum TaxID=329046 RepID=A0A1Y2CFZ6_9FUNG|nr:hypothetical protein BCR33DRAFT_156475 [Rhizoclosmatium globosum]|eukprot:ORY45960.1 hypothetical protein BCR33DRAFT_156475 [Rhizoclosmatium globosum]